jgi:hypothetical protein
VLPTSAWKLGKKCKMASVLSALQLVEIMRVAAMCDVCVWRNPVSYCNSKTHANVQQNQCNGVLFDLRTHCAV